MPAGGVKEGLLNTANLCALIFKNPDAVSGPYVLFLTHIQVDLCCKCFAVAGFDI